MGFLFGAGSLVFGLAIGSFLNVVIYRVPRRIFLSGGLRSRCPHCGASIPTQHNLPILSYLMLRGRARCCGQRISPRYPIIEAITGVAFLLVWLQHRQLHPAGSGTSLELFFITLYLVASLIAASAIDLEHRILPDAINFLGIGVGILSAVLVPELHAQSFLAGPLAAVPVAGRSLLASVLGVLAGAGSLYLVALIGRRVYGRDAMGLGDVKFMAFTGSFIGADGVLIAVFVACFLGAVIGILVAFKTGDPMIPFGPFLAAGVLLAHFGKARAIEALAEDWPRWLRTSPLALPVLGAVGLLCVGAMFWLRRIRRQG